MEVVGVYAKVEGWVLVLGGSKQEMVKMRRRRVLYWWVVRGIGRLVLGGGSESQDVPENIVVVGEGIGVLNDTMS